MSDPIDKITEADFEAEDWFLRENAGDPASIELP